MRADPPGPAPPRFILATSNGVGMGHLARQAAVALALRDVAEPVIFSMSPALPSVLEMGLRGEYCPSLRRGFIPRSAWDGYLLDRLRALVAETGARILLYDGVVPYLGLLRARLLMPEVAFVWMRPGLWRRGTNLSALEARRFFDLVLEPGDLAAPADAGATATCADAVRVGPVTLLERAEQLPRAEAARRLGLDPARPAALVTLRTGSGLSGPPACDPARPAALRSLLAGRDWQVAVTHTPVAETRAPEPDEGRVVVLRDVFPLASYLSAFDAAVVEAGYNAVHEMLHAGLPALLVPTSAAVTDDQPARARWAAENGFALTAGENDPAAVADAAKQLLDPAVRERLAARCETLQPPRGASDTAGLLAELAAAFGGHRFSLAEHRRIAQLALQACAARILGQRGRTTARRVLGRAPDPAPARRLPVTVAVVGAPADRSGTPLLIADRVTGSELWADHPVEHLLAGSSPAYRRERERIAGRYYDLRTRT